MAKNWNDFEKFDYVINKYMPDMGEGETQASQIVTAVNKLIYKWYNDGDVFDNTGMLEGWANDLSSYANWLYLYVGKETGADHILESVYECMSGGEYEDLLYNLTETLLDEEWLDEDKAEVPKTGSIYNCNGMFKFEEESEDEDEEWW